MFPFHNWLSCFSKSKCEASARKSTRKKRSNAISGSSEALEQRTLLSATATVFTGGDVNEGLDLDGAFKYAIDYSRLGPTSKYTIRDANFVAEGLTGATDNARNQIASFVVPNYGNTQNDKNLSYIVNDIVHNPPDSNLQITLPDVIVGNRYKLQLIFADASSVRGFDIRVEGALVLDDFRPSAIHGVGQQNSEGTVVTYEFVANDKTVNIELNGAATNFADKNPIINALTLEDLRPIVTFGAVVSPTEGFGYGSTIAGLGTAIDTTLPGTVAYGQLSTTLGNDVLGIKAAGQYTFEAWFYPKSGQRDGVIWNYSESSQLLRVNNTGLRLIQHRTGVFVPGSTFDVTVADVLNPDAWNHLATTFDGSVLRLFVNGVEVVTERDIVPDFLDVSLPAIINVSLRDSSLLPAAPGGAGMIDEIRAWNVAKTQAEVQDAALQALTGQEPGLVGYWNFDNPSGLDSSNGKFYTELDSTGSSRFLNISPRMRVENAAPQIGYVDVQLNTPVIDPLGLFVTYSLSTNSATRNVDYYSSRFRVVSSDPATERDGIIIPQGESTGRIYFMARSDVVSEASETITVAATPFGVRGDPNFMDYNIRPGSASATLTIADSGAYVAGVVLLDATGRPVTATNPLYFNPTTNAATFGVKLSSQPSAPVRIRIQGENGAATLIDFTPENWDQVVTLTHTRTASSGLITIVDERLNGVYFTGPITFPFTKSVPDVGLVEEGNPNDLAAVKPTVNLSLIRSIHEDEDLPALVRVLLNTAAPEGGMDVSYSVTGGTAVSGVNFQPLSGLIHIDQGLLEADIPIYPINDSVDQGAGLNLSVSLVSRTSYILGPTRQATVTITNDDHARISIANPSYIDVSVTRELAGIPVTETVANYSSTYATLTMVEPTPVSVILTEPNNALATAYQLDTVYDGVSIPSQVIDNSSDVDLYRFKLNTAVTRPELLQLNCTFEAAANIRLEILNRTTGAVLLSAVRAQTNYYLDLSSLTDGEYIVRVRAEGTAANNVSYGLKFISVKNSVEVEGNDSEATATFLGVVRDGDRFSDLAIVSGSDKDYYRFRLDSSASRPASVSLLGLLEDGVIAISLVNPARDAALAPVYRGLGVKQVSLNDLPDGDYVLYVRGSLGSIAKYDLAFGTLTPRVRETDLNQVALRLDSKPIANVTLSLNQTGTTEGRLSTTSLVFTPDNWDKFQVVTVTPLDDNTVDGDKTWTVTATAASTDANYQNRTLTFTLSTLDRGNFVTPNYQSQYDTYDEPDAPTVKIEALQTTGLVEGNIYDAFKITLSRALTTDLTIGLDYDRGTAVYGTDFVAITGNTDPRTVTLLKGTTTKIIRVNLLNDLVDESFANIAETIRATIIDTKDIVVPQVADPGFSAKIQVVDTNVADYVVIGPAGFADRTIASTDENPLAGIVTETIRLASKPASNVTVYVDSSDPTEGLVRLTPTSTPSYQIALVFTPDNWDVDQNFYLSGVNDSLDDGSVPYNFVVSSTSDDEVYHRLTGRAYSVINADDDTLGITVTSPQATVNGRANVFSVVLNTQPLGEVRVTMTPQNEQIFLNGGRPGDPLTLTFDAANWNIAQLVQAAAFDDGVVEYFHTSQVNFSISTGRELDGPSVADLTVASRALELGDVSGGVRWTNLNLPLNPNATPAQSPTNPIWLGIDFPSKPDSLGTVDGVFGALQKFRLLTAGDNSSDLPTLELYKSDGLTRVAVGVFTPAVKDANFFVTQKAFTTLNLNQLAEGGHYLIKLSGRIGSRQTFDLLIDDADRAYEKVSLSPVMLSIKDNDLPIAEILAGPTASEISSQPSYFAVRLNAPAPAEPGDTGIKVFFKVSGGRASVGVESSAQHDYTINADQFDPVTGLGFVRVAPGDIQANIGIVPVDDKLVEDLPVKLSAFNSTLNRIRITAKRDLIDATAPYQSSYSLTAGTVVTAQLASGQEITLTVSATTSLTLNVNQTEYSGEIPVTMNGRDKSLATTGITGATSADGRVRSEDVEITLLSGSNYLLPLAADKQNANRAIAANLDQTRTVANLKIFDDDVPGIQVIEIGDHTTVAEGETAEFQVSLTAEPRNPVTVTLTPSGGLVFINPVDATNADINVVSYTMGTVGIPPGVDLTFVSMHETSLGFTAVFDARLSRVTYQTLARNSILSITGQNGGGSESANFRIAGTNDVDAAGNPDQGDWDIVQRMVVGSLKQNDNGSFSLSVSLNGGTPTTITLTPATAVKSAKTSTLTFNASNWYLPQTVSIRKLTNAIAEPGDWYRESIAYQLGSADVVWNNLPVPAQEIHARDTVLDVGDTISGLTSGLHMLQDGLLGLELPLLGTVGDLPILSDLFGQVEQPLEISLASQDDVTVTRFQVLAESALQPLINAGLLDTVSVVPSADENEVRVDLHFDKLITLGEFDLSADLGLEALGIRFNTTGKAVAVIEFSLDIGFGWNRQFGFFLDTETTGMHLGAKLTLEGNGATSDNPNNLFTGQGSLGFLQLDFTDDPENSTELGITFDVRLNDLDNLGTVQFFDINGDGILGESSFMYNVGTDLDNNGRIDENASGNPVLSLKEVVEPWTNLGADGTVNSFPAVDQLSDPKIVKAAQANWNVFGESKNTFTEATSIRNEGVYRISTVGGVSIVYLDLDRDGQLDVARRNVDPFTLNWTDLNNTEKNSSEIWFKTTTPQLVSNWTILTTGTGAATAYFVDVNSDGIRQAGEVISTSLRKKLDKDSSNILEEDIIRDGEGTFVQGTSTAFYDRDGDKKLDFNEAFISYGFNDFMLSTEVFVEDSNGNRFIDLNGDGILNAADLRMRTVTGTDNVYLDYNNSNSGDLLEPLILKSEENFKLLQSEVNATTSLIRLGTVSYSVRTIDGVRFIDLDGNGELTRDDEDRPLEPFAEQRTSLNFADLSRLVVKIDAIDNTVFSAESAEVVKLKAGTALNLNEQSRLTTRFNALLSSGKIIEQVNDGHRLTLDELLAFRRSIRSNNTTAQQQIQSGVSELFSYQFQGNVNLGLTPRTSISGSTDFPSFQFDLAVNIPIFNFGDSEEAGNDGMTVQFNDVALDLGSFLGKYMQPILATANDLVEPIKPLIAALNADTKLLGMIGLASAFESDGKPGVSLLEIAKKLSPSPADKAKIDKAIFFANQLTKLVNVVDTLSKNLSNDSFLIEFGDFTLDDLRAASKDPANSSSRAVDTLRADGTPATRQTIPTATAASIEQQAQQSSRFKNAFNSLKQLDGLKFDLFNPSTIFSLITGEDNVRLITYDIPDIDFEFSLDRTFRIWGPLAGKLEGGFKVKSDLSLGYDTHGFQEWAETDYAIDKSYLVFDGLFLDDWNTGQVDKDELTVTAYVGAGLGLDVGIANGFVKGGVEGVISLDFVDAGERAGTSDGRVRGSDIIEALAVNPANLFDLSGRISAYLGAEVNVNMFFFKAKVYDKRLATFELAKFKLSAGSFTGTNHAGRVQTGTTSGATVWLDVNNNQFFDADEPFAITDFEGRYELNVPDDIDFAAGPIRVQGGTDVSTGLPATDVVTIPPGQGGNATAFTSLELALIELPIDTNAIDFNADLIIDELDEAWFYDTLGADPQNPLLDLTQDATIDTDDIQEFERLFQIALNEGHLTVPTSQQLIESAFGIDPAIDLSTFLHFDEALAGNPLAAPVMLAENSVNSLVTQIEAVLTGASGLSRHDLQLSGVVSAATFDSLARQILRGGLDLTQPEQLRAIVLDALDTSAEWIINHGLNFTLDRQKVEPLLDDIVDVLRTTIMIQQTLASLAGTPAQLVEFITQSKVWLNGTVAQGLHDFVTGDVSLEELANFRRSDSEILEQIQSLALPPMVSTISDVFLPEDSDPVDIPFHIVTISHLPGGIEIFATSNNPELFPDEGFLVSEGENSGEYLVTLHPVSNAQGTAVITLHVLDTNGAEATLRFNVTVTAVGDAPVANADRFMAVAGRTTILNPLVNDFDLEGDPLSIGLASSLANGQLSINGDQTINYRADNAIRSVQSFLYQIDDGNGGIATSTVEVEVLNPLSVDEGVVSLDDDAVGNSGRLATGDGITAVLSASIGTVSDLGDGIWEWRLAADETPIPSQVVTISVIYNGTLHDQVDFTLRAGLAILMPPEITVAEPNRSVAIIEGVRSADQQSPLIFAISGGEDKAAFVINKRKGALRFKKTPLFAAPKDVGSDNTYRVQVSASDGTTTVRHNIVVKVTRGAANSVRLRQRKASVSKGTGALTSPITLGRKALNIHQSMVQVTVSNEQDEATGSSAGSLDALFSDTVEL